MLRSTLGINNLPNVELNTGSLAMWNTNGSFTFYLVISEPALLAFNTVGSISCGASAYNTENKLMYGNSATTISDTHCGKKSDNVTSGTTSTKKLIFPYNFNPIATLANVSTPLPRILYADKNGFLTNAQINWTLSYTLDGATYPFGTGFTTSETGNVTIDTQEYYILQSNTLNATSEFLGSFSIPIEVSIP